MTGENLSSSLEMDNIENIRTKNLDRLRDLESSYGLGMQEFENLKPAATLK